MLTYLSVSKVKINIEPGLMQACLTLNLIFHNNVPLETVELRWKGVIVYTSFVVCLSFGGLSMGLHIQNGVNYWWEIEAAASVSQGDPHTPWLSCTWPVGKWQKNLWTWVAAGPPRKMKMASAISPALYSRLKSICGTPLWSSG